MINGPLLDLGILAGFPGWALLFDGTHSRRIAVTLIVLSVVCFVLATEVGR